MRTQGLNNEEDYTELQRDDYMDLDQVELMNKVNRLEKDLL